MADQRLDQLTARTAPASTDLAYLEIDPGVTQLPRKVTLGVLGAFLAQISGGRLTKSGSNLLLSPYLGNQLPLNNGLVTIPDAGVTLAPTSLSSSTTYQIYAYLSGSTLTLEASAVAWVVQTGTGLPIKSGDATRTLVGLARTTAGTAWADTDAQRFVLSYWNRRTIRGRSAFTTARTTASTTTVELNTEIRVEFLTWADETVYGAITGTVTPPNAAYASSALCFDGTTIEVQSGVGSSASAMTYPIGLTTHTALAEGYHYMTLTGFVNSGTGSWAGADTVGLGKCRTTIAVRG